MATDAPSEKPPEIYIAFECGSRPSFRHRFRPDLRFRDS